MSSAVSRRLRACALSLAVAMSATAAASAPRVDDAPTPAVAPAPPPLERLRDAARAADSSALLVWQDGRYLVEDYDAAGAKPVSVQSISKSVVSLAIGKLVAEGRIASIDDPVSKYLPEFVGDGREKITLRQVLTHTSGLEVGEMFGLEVENAYSFLAAAVATKPSAAPGRSFRYDNRAWQLACGVFRSAAGEDVQDYLRREVFAPMGIERFEWSRDRSGATVCHAALQLLPRDLVKIGRLLLDRGRYDGRRIIPEAWFDLALPRHIVSEFHRRSGIWWEDVSLDEQEARVRIDRDGMRRMIEHGLSAQTAKNLQATDGGAVAGFWDAYIALSQEAQLNFRDARIAASEAGMVKVPVEFEGDIVAVLATGGGGQYLHVDLRSGRIVVRLIDPTKVDGQRTAMSPAFRALVAELP
jgi:CubicO group peptidase (beta-lactamase class C family)